MRIVTWASVILCGLMFTSREAPAEPLRLVIASAIADTDMRTGHPIVTVRLVDDSRRLFAKLTLSNMGHAIDVRIDGKSVSKPLVREPIMSGSFQIEIGEPEEAKRLAAGLSDQTATLEMEALPK